MLDRKSAPGYVQDTSFDLIKPRQTSLPNGVDIFFIHGGSQDVLKIELTFKAGRWFETTWGASHFTSHLLAKGTKNKSSFEIAQWFDRYGAHVDVNAGLDVVSISLYTLTKNLQPVIGLLQEILQEPVFPEKELEQSKSIYIQNLKVNHEKTSFLAAKHFRKNLFGEDHPYGKEIEEGDVNNLQQKDLFDHFNTRLQHFSVFVSGKFDHTHEALIADTFSKWKPGTATEGKTKPGNLKPASERIEKEGSVQSSIRTGTRSILRAHPDYSKVVFVSHILGGYFGSRLMKNIREEKGLTYGIHASLLPLRHDSYLAIGADVNKENVDLAFSEIRKELKRLREEKISFDELETARNHFIGSLQSELTTPFAHADKLRVLYLFGLPDDYYQRMIDTVQQISVAQIMETGEQYFNEEKFFEIAVG